MFGIVHGLCWLKTHNPVRPCGSIVRLSTHDEVCKIEPAQKGSTVSEALKGVEARIKRDVDFQKEIEVLKEQLVIE